MGLKPKQNTVHCETLKPYKTQEKKSRHSQLGYERKILCSLDIFEGVSIKRQTPEEQITHPEQRQLGLHFSPLNVQDEPTTGRKQGSKLGVY